MATTHKIICSAVRADWSKTNRGRLWDNETGGAYRIYNGKQSFIRYGLDEGSSDLIGFEIVSGLPVFCGVEVKTKSYPKLSNNQIEWCNMLLAFGARVYLARESNNDKGYILERWNNDML